MSVKAQEREEETVDAKPASPRGGKSAAIVAAAKRLFLAQGYMATSMDAVAREAPVSKRTLYNHFPSKEALFTAMVTDAYAPFTKPHDACQGVCDPREALRAYVERMRSHWGHPDVMPLLRLIVAEGATAPGLMDSYLAAGKGPAIIELTRIFEYVDDPLGMPAETRALQFLGMIKEGLFWPGVLGIPSGREPETVIEQAISRILGSAG